jgi:hypothetical protein
MVIEAEHHDVRLDADGRFRGEAEIMDVWLRSPRSWMTQLVVRANKN